VSGSESLVKRRLSREDFEVYRRWMRQSLEGTWTRAGRCASGFDLAGILGAPSRTDRGHWKRGIIVPKRGQAEIWKALLYDDQNDEEENRIKKERKEWACTKGG